MDKIKGFFAVFMKYHFWILTTLVVVVGVVGWYLASDGLAKQFAVNAGKVESEFNKLQNISNTDAHPNDKVNKGVDDKTDELRQRVLEAWNKLYEMQRDEVLRWPEELGEEFLETINALKYPDKIPDTQRERYQYFIKDYVKELSKIVESQEIDDTGAPIGGNQLGRMFPGAPVTPEVNYKVIWQDQFFIESKFVWPDKPKEKQIWLAQEDLWVYEMLLKIIQRTNQDAEGHHDAPIKVIENLEVGNEAPTDADLPGRIFDPIAAGAGPGARFGGGLGAMGRPGDPRAFLGGGLAGGLGGFGGVRGIVDPATAMLTNRYVDDKGKPLPATQEIPEYKRLPVRMVLQMDQRELPRLLAECANAALRVEVTEVRINADGAPDGRAGGMRGGMGRGMGGARRQVPRGGARGGGRAMDDLSVGPRGGGGRGPARRPGGGGGSRRLGARRGGLAGRGMPGAAGQDPNQAQVIVQGIVYLYNRPDLAVLGIAPPVATVGTSESPVAANQ